MSNRIVLALLGATLLAGPARTQEAPYRLGAEDKVRVRVTEWRAARGEAYVWEALSGEYAVDSTGQLSLPLVGAIPAGGRTAQEVGTSIGEELQRRIGLVHRPDAAVEVAQFRPFFVVGQVDKPGAYPFRPQLTVLQAVGLAGGLYRAPNPGDLRLAREAIGVQGDLRQVAGERAAVLARRARLEAEKRGDATITFPPDLTGPRAEPIALDAIREEQALFEARREALRSQITAITQAKALLDTEIQSLQAKIASQDRQIGLARKELDTINGLMERGLVSSPRQLALEQMVAQLESTRLDSQVAISRARQDIARNERAILDLKTQRQSTVLADLREAQIRLAHLEEKAATARGLLADTAFTAPQLVRRQKEAERLAPVYTLVRTSAEGSREFTVAETDPVLPGDVLKVSKGGDREDVSDVTAPLPASRALASMR